MSQRYNLSAITFWLSGCLILSVTGLRARDVDFFPIQPLKVQSESGDLQTLTERRTVSKATSRGHGATIDRDLDRQVLEGLIVDYCVPNNPDSTPLQLALFFHGDGNEHPRRKVWDEFSRKHHILLVYFHSPLSESRWRAGEMADDETRIEDKVASSIRKLQTDWNLYTENILYAGWSGGAGFLTQGFFPMHGEDFKGPAALIAGGVAPSRWVRHSEQVRKEFSRDPFLPQSLYFVFGERDWMVSEDRLKSASPSKPGMILIPSTVQAYRQVGFAVSETEIPHANHDFSDMNVKDWPEVELAVLEVWSRHLIQ